MLWKKRILSRINQQFEGILRLLMRKISDLRNYPLLILSVIYALVIGAYLIDSKSRSTLAEAKSSHLGNNLQGKILLIIISFIVAVSLIGLVNSKKIQNIYLEEKNFYKFLPVIFFTLLNALPAVIHSRKNLSFINFYYSVMQVGNTFPNFIDLKQTVGFLLHKNVDKIGDEGLIYPTFILKMRFLNPILDSDFALHTIAYVTILLFAWMIFDFSQKLSSIQNIFLAILVVSPPFLLLIDRQNIDCILILLIYLSASMYNKNDFKSVFAIVLITSASLIKIYPIIILGYFVLTNRSALVKLSALTALAIAAYLIYPDLFLIQKFQVTDIAGSAGLPVFMAHLAGSPVAGFYVSLTFILFVILLILILFHSNHSISVSLESSDQKSVILIFGSLILIETLMLSTNYLYRMSYIIFLVPLIGILPRKSIVNISFLFFMFGIFLSPRSTGLLFNLFLFPFLINLILFVIKQFNIQIFKIYFAKKKISNKTNN